MSHRFLILCAMLASLVSVAGGRAPASRSFQQANRDLLKEDVPKVIEKFAGEMTDLREQMLDLQARDASERRVERLEEKITELKKEYEADIKRDLERFTKDAEKLSARIDRVLAGMENADEAKTDALMKKRDEIQSEVAFLTLQRSILEAYKGYSVGESKAGVAEYMVDRQAPDFRLSKSTGDARSLETVSTAPVLVLVFVSTQNRASILHAASMANSFGNQRDVEVVAIAVGETRESWDESRINMRNTTVLLDPDGKTSMEYWVGYVPHTVVLDKDRVITAATIGTSSDPKATITRAVKDAVAASNKDDD